MHGANSTAELLKPLPKAGVRAPSATRGRRVVKAQATDSAVRLGSRIEKWVQSPFDIAAFGPRATVGALLSAPERLQNLQSDLERLSELVQDDSRPSNEKKEVVLKEIEARLADCLYAGANLEADILANLKTVLPQQIADAIPDPVLPTSVEPVPETPAVQVEPEPLFSVEAVTESQTTVGRSVIDAEIKTTTENLDALRNNQSPSRENMLKLNLSESRDRLERLLEEMTSTDIGDSALEARSLIREVDVALGKLDV